MVSHKMTLICPTIFRRPFLNTVNAKIECKKQTIGVSFGDESHEFNFSKFNKKLHKKEFPSKDEIIGLASIAVPPIDPLEIIFARPWKWYASAWKKWNR